MTRRQAQVLALVKARPGIRRCEIAAELGCAGRTAGVYLWILKDAGLIHADGVGRYTGWKEGAAPDVGRAAAANDLMAAWFGRAA